MNSLRQVKLDQRVYRTHAVGDAGKPLRQHEAMITIIFISFLALIGAAFSIYLWQRTPSSESTRDRVLPAPRSEGLFDRPDAALFTEEEQQRTLGHRNQNLLDLARVGDLSALDEARLTGDTKLYADVLDNLVDWAGQRQESFGALVSHISKSDDLRANKRLAQRFIESWKRGPDRRTTTAMIHIAALADDAETYEQAIEAALASWRRGELAQFSAEELVALFVSQYWVIAPEVRRGGVGFALKRRLLGVRRELATAASAR